jgi:aldehyde dehydrogenase (NAD+)
VADVFDHHAGWADKIAGETLPPYQGGDHMVLTLREPVGVVGAVIPWNAPLVLFAQKVAPALAAGCTVVLKPSEYATFAVLRLAQLINDVLPAGVLNVVTGPGDPAGQALISHPMVDKLSFTGSRAVGQKVMTAAVGCKRVSLELGGKSPSVVFQDADIGTAAAVTMGTVTLGLSGQVCAAQTRALVQREAIDEFLATAELIGTMVSYGSPFDPEVTSAPLINTRQLDRVLGLIARGREEGARLVCGGGRADGDELAQGNFVAPTLFADVSNDMSIAREEIFGPVLSVIPFDGEQEAVRLANDTDYGLAATVWTSDVRRAMRMTKAIKAGTVGVNGYQLEPNSPFGGFRQSGLGREGGRAAIESYTEIKTVLLPFTDEMM